ALGHLARSDDAGHGRLWISGRAKEGPAAGVHPARDRHRRPRRRSQATGQRCTDCSETVQRPAAPRRPPSTRFRSRRPGMTTPRNPRGRRRSREKDAPATTRDGAQARARAAEQRFQLVVESIKDYAIFMLDPSGHIATWNEGAKLIKGYLQEDVIGRDMSIFYLREDLARGKPRALLDAALAEGRVEDEGWRLRKDGSRFWADVVITPIRDPQGQLQG